MEETKPKRYRRTKADIEKSIKQAAETIILKKGFSEMTVLDIIKHAKIEPITFYTRYRNLEEFYDSFVREYDYWLNDMLKMSQDKASTQEGYVEIFKNLTDSLKEDSIMLELLRWEVNDANNLTKRSAMNREIQTLPLVATYENLFKDADVDFVAVSALLIAGIYYLSLHKRCSPFCGIDIKTEEGRNRLINAIEALSDKLFMENESTPQKYHDKMASIAERMRQKGFSEEDIDYCLSD